MRMPYKLRGMSVPPLRRQPSHSIGTLPGQLTLVEPSQVCNNSQVSTMYQEKQCEPDCPNSLRECKIVHFTV